MQPFRAVSPCLRYRGALIQAEWMPNGLPTHMKPRISRQKSVMSSQSNEMKKIYVRQKDWFGPLGPPAPDTPTRPGRPLQGTEDQRPQQIVHPRATINRKSRPHSVHSWTFGLPDRRCLSPQSPARNSLQSASSPFSFTHRNHTPL